MSVNINVIKELTKKLAIISSKKYKSLNEVKADFDKITMEFIDIGNNDNDLIDTLDRAAKYFNLLEEVDFNTNDPQRINESKAVVSKLSQELNTILIRWREKLTISNSKPIKKK